MFYPGSENFSSQISEHRISDPRISDLGSSYVLSKKELAVKEN
jgi:hypothetical protein